MMLIVSGVGGLIVLYSIGYMDGDPEERRYFAYMSLFVFSMLLLVQAANFLLLLAGWGLVGLASYLLIGFWHQRPEAVAAAKKAFVMNAFGDATMALAFFVLMWQTGTLNFAESFIGADGLSQTAVNLVALGLLGGAVAKSAQIPLHTWLPDAMEGPTPVSALIHAATMVTAGVYLIVRAHPIFELAPSISDLAAGLGAITLLVAGLVALVQTDIKRVIAYSTMSQIGYMFVGAGLGAYSSAMFHLMTHAFFKALLFLAAGVIIHHLAGEQDIRKMGGLRGSMPKTYIAFLIGSLALVGIPPLAGFFSKDAILAVGARERRLRPGSLLRRPDRGAADGPLHLPPLLHRLPRRAVAARPGARGGARPRRGPVDDDGAGRRPLRALRRRRLDRGRGRLAHVRRVARPDRDRAGAARPRRADDDAGLRHERARRRARRDRDLRRLAVLRRPPWAGAEVSRPREHARAQVLVRRALRPDLLQARRPAHARPAARGRRAA